MALGLTFVVLNLVGVREATRAQMALVLGMFALMLLYVVRGLPMVKMEAFVPFAPRGLSAVFSTAGFVFVSYGGLLKIASVAEEIRRPGRTIPVGMILSLLVTSVFYALMLAVTVGVLPAGQLDGSLTPIADGALVLMGRSGQMALGVAAALAFLTTANAGIMTGSRYLLAMSRDGMLPPVTGRIGARFHTPHVAILLTGTLVILPLFVDLHVLVESASVGLILTNILANISVIVLRESRVQNYRPIFRTPLYPWLQVAGVIGFAFLLIEMGPEALAVSALLGFSAFCLYWFYGRTRVLKESALLHLIRRITARELVTSSLEAELKQIIRDRDEIITDRFDQIVENCVVVDTMAILTAQELFSVAAERLSARLGMDRKTIFDALATREQQSSTVISPGLAVPHVVIEGAQVFNILLARSHSGFFFTADRSAVHCVFVLIGSKDERNFHLQALAAIAQIVQEPGFENRWLAARGEQGLRDLVLLGNRRRS